jgi:hypothetical protein
LRGKKKTKRKEYDIFTITVTKQTNMKKLAIILVLVGLFALTGCADSYPQKLSVYSFDTAIIQYHISGISEGDETVYIRGDQKATHRYVLNPDGEENTLQIDLGSERYHADLNKMTAVKVENDDYGKLLAMSKEDQEKHLIRKELGLKESVEVPDPETTSVIAGQVCDVYEIPNLGTACIWDGIVLKKEISMFGAVSSKVAVSVDTNVEISKDNFELPAGVILTNE